MTPLAAQLARRIAAAGPISVAEFMAECLLDPEYGYYTCEEPFGTAGDFTTAPEISQMFGELLGLWLAQVWLDQGTPLPFTLAELGPGRGTLMADMLRATGGVPGFHEGADIHLVEMSPRLRAAQRDALEGLAVTWHDQPDTLPEAPLFVIANEFFDALPVRQFQRDISGWRERQIGLVEGALSFGLSAPAPLGALAHRLADTTPGEIVETCQGAAPVVAALAARIQNHGGAALICDYGGWRSRGDTLQALYRHAFDPPLAHPGQADLTAHVDFEALTRAARGVRVSAMTPQGVFLERLGITARAQALARGLTGAALENHIAAHRRLTHPQEMGTLFKIIALTPQTAAAPPGLDP
ncbi:SAM-dependent MidA family methyltransferase [Rhodovulum bhavnagarense]|uniref:SAM-dependent MidA family methyltransferase n=1 Tax=Rhodovulum bhavnagarense TaxID=992286 RepID=A0A4R2RJZ9_9RHOB|nr:SAM-dependent methyltransferase [Rhodovulum bhavnagarense]TCP63108.1 SAM-dependent MidA family methyltransferase [Rhodovulum bhavnagarense]